METLFMRRHTCTGKRSSLTVLAQIIWTNTKELLNGLEQQQYNSKLMSCNVAYSCNISNNEDCQERN